MPQRHSTTVGEARRPTRQPRPTRPTRLLIVTNMYPTPDRPQTGPFVALRVAALRERGVEVVVAGPSGYRGSSLLRHLRIAWRALTARGHFDGVEAHGVYLAGVLALPAARLRRIPLLAYAHGGDVADYGQRNRVSRALTGWVVRGAAAIVANSGNTAGHVERFGATARVVSPGVDMSVFRPVRSEAAPAPVGAEAERAPAGVTERAAVRARLALPEGLVALYLGTLSERKGADIFAAALDLAASSGWSGVMIGDGDLAESIARDHPSVRRLPPTSQAEMADWMRAADVVVVPSRREPLGLAAVEALACGTPVVASAVGGLKEVVRDVETGLLIAPANPDALASALARLKDDALRARLAAAAPASVARHNIRAAAAEMAQVWLELGVRA
ncbi:MAG TPA: glycosyltransferase [Candidatus Limnocylindrales bacterium]